MDVDEKLARQWLRSVSYYRLSGYWYPYRQLRENPGEGQPKRLDCFALGTRFSDVAKLYEFDRKLRTLIHDGMERIEVALRARIGEVLTSDGEYSYYDSSIFRPDFNHRQWIETATTRVERAKKRNESIRHYASHYRDYPFWVLAEVLDFSDISLLFDGLYAEKQRKIAKSFGLEVVPELLKGPQKKNTLPKNPLPAGVNN